LERASYQVEKLHAIAEHSPDQLSVITSLAELETHLADRADGSKVIGGILGNEGAHPLQDELSNMDRLEAAVHRVIGLQHFFDNDLGGSLHGFRNRSLTDFGHNVVADISTRGMVLDLTHSSPQVAQDLLDITDMPIIVSHTAIYGRCPAKRNFPDDLMRRIAASGGVLGIGYWAKVACGDLSPSGIARMIKTGIEEVSVDHISLGSDFDDSVETAFDTSELLILTHALLEVGLSQEDIRKLMGENLIRFLRARLK
jgi:membrane dipeptidase